jgi:hypothetical protein
MPGLGVLAGGGIGERPLGVNVDEKSELGFFNSGGLWEWSLEVDMGGTFGRGPRGAGLGGGSSNCRDLIDPPGLGIGTRKSNEGVGSIGEGPGLACAGSSANGVVLAASSNLLLMALVEGSDGGSEETATDSLGTGECSEACL